METEYSQLLDELPHLYRARAFADSLQGLQLFGAAGQPLDEVSKDLALRYAEGLGFPHTSTAPLLHWQEALQASEAADEDPAAWEAEEQMRLALTDEAIRQTSDQGAAALLQLVAAEASSLAKEQVSDLFSHMDEEAMASSINCLVGHVTRAAHCAALAILAEQEADEGIEAEPEQYVDQHPFLLRWALYRQGRWPVGIIGGSFNLF